MTKPDVISTSESTKEDIIESDPDKYDANVLENVNIIFTIKVIKAKCLVPKKFFLKFFLFISNN